MRTMCYYYVPPSIIVDPSTALWHFGAKAKNNLGMKDAERTEEEELVAQGR